VQDGRAILERKVAADLQVCPHSRAEALQLRLDVPLKVDVKVGKNWAEME
jgi:DNA polymerase I-like protein with 3'-5' exonuclease and polymerase domains